MDLIKYHYNKFEIIAFDKINVWAIVLFDDS